MTVDETPKDPENPKGSGKPDKLRARHALRVTSLVLLAPLVFVLISALMLIDRDITAPEWIKQRLSERAALVLNGGSVEFGSIFIRVGRDLHPHVRLADTVLRDRDNNAIARISSLSGLMSPRGLIFRREVLLQEVALTGAQIDLRRNADGSVALAFDQGRAIGRATGLIGLLDQADVVFEQPAFEALEKIRADGLFVNFQDARAGRSWTVDGGTIDLDLGGETTALRGAFVLLGGRAAVTDVALSYESPRGSRAATLGLTINDAVAADLAAQSPALNWLRDFDAPISGNLRTTLDGSGQLGPLNATLALGAGAVRPNATAQPINFEGVKAYLTFDPVTEVIDFAQIDIAAERGNVQASGTARLGDIEGGLPQSLTGQFQFRDGVIKAGSFGENPITIPIAQVDMRFHLKPLVIEIGQAYVETGGVAIVANGRIGATPNGWDIALNAHAPKAERDQIMALWPPDVQKTPRNWLATNLSAANLTGLHAAYRRRPKDAPTYAVEFAFDSAEVSVMHTMPPIKDAAGFATIADRTFALVLDSGTVTAPQGGPMQAAGSQMILRDLGVKNPPAAFDLHFDGTVTAALSLTDQPPFEYLTKAGLPVVLADGRADVRLQMAMPMRSRYQRGEIDYSITADLRDLRSDTLIPGRAFAAQRLTVSVDPAGMTIAGPARLGNINLDGSYTRPFDGSGSSRVQASMTLSEQVLDTFNIALPPGSVNGSGRGALDLRLAPGQLPSFTLTSGLRGIGVAIPPIGWAKPQNTAGNLTVAGTLGPVPQITKFEVGGGGLDAAGRIVLNGNGSLDRAVFDRVRVGDWLNAAITLRGRGQGRPVGVEIKGGTVDLRQARFGRGQGDGGPISIALDRLQVTEGIALTRFAGDFSSAGGFAGQFSASLNGAAQIRGTVAPSNGRSAVRLVSDDAGGVARAAGLLQGGVGGTLDLTLLPANAEGTFDGTLAMRDLRLRDAPAMASLLDAISVVGLIQQLDGQGLAFDAVDARFRLTPTQVILAQSSAVGPGLGISLDGIYTLASKQLDFQGVVSPFYLINSIGSFLTRQGEGLIGFNFTIKGLTTAPQVNVNPLSVFTPGMFREIFRRAPPEINP